MHTLCKKSVYSVSKKKSTWRIYVGHYDVDLNTIHGCDCVWWNACIYTKSLNGDSQSPYLNWNGDKRKLNANDVSNDWNEHNRFVFVRNLISFSHTNSCVGVFLFLSGLLFDYLVVPTTKHFTSLVQFFAKSIILFRFKCFYSMCNTKKNFNCIKNLNSLLNIY